MNVLSVLNSPWALLPEKMLEIREVYNAHLRGEAIDVAAIEARIGKPLRNKSLGYQVVDGVAVLPIDGVIAKRMNMFMEISGGVSSELLQSYFVTALNDPTAHSILLLVDSPGGQVDGTQQTANLIRNARGIKPVYALADGMMASAAYWIASAAEKVFAVSDTTLVGSIGVVATHTDYSKAQAQAGVKVTDIVAGKYKRIASENAPLSQEGLATIQAQLDHVYAVFVDAVAENRGVSARTVLSNMADGRVFMGKQAVEAGLVDGISSMSDLISQLAQRNVGSTALTALAESSVEIKLEVMPRVCDPGAMAIRISDYVAEQNRQGNTCSYAQAAAHIERLDGHTHGEDADSTAMATRISGYVAEQRQLGNACSYAQAAAHIERLDRNERGASDDPGVIALGISDYIRKQERLGRKVSPAQAAAQIELLNSHKPGTESDPGAMAIRISDYVAEQNKLGNAVSYAQAAAQIDEVSVSRDLLKP